ncbi:MAG: MBL fold metallo-hydrolase [Anaerolineae bacterium]|jgi:L-ascorbate metabolism protein UlaG (beta-lactamase superfamily)
MRLTLIGHMTVRIELDGLALLTDPWFGPRTWLERRLAPRTLPPAVSPDEMTALDALLVSHNHIDHLDEPALALARRLGCAVIGSEKAARRARRAGAREAVPLRAGETTTLGPLTIHAVPADHPLAPDAVGFVVVGSHSLYFSGDTRWTPALQAALSAFALDIALIQAACAHYPLFGDDGMSLAEAAALARALRPRWTVPLHLHCTGKWLDRGAGIRIEMGNADRVQAALAGWAAALRLEGLGVQILEPGQPTEYATRKNMKEAQDEYH